MGAALDDPYSVAWLLSSLRAAGADEQAAALLARDPAAHAALDVPSHVAQLLHILRTAVVGEAPASDGTISSGTIVTGSNSFRETTVTPGPE